LDESDAEGILITLRSDVSKEKDAAVCGVSADMTRPDTYRLDTYRLARSAA
jgi:hypothetical protein